MPVLNLLALLTNDSAASLATALSVPVEKNDDCVLIRTSFFPETRVKCLLNAEPFARAYNSSQLTITSKSLALCLPSKFHSPVKFNAANFLPYCGQ